MRRNDFWIQMMPKNNELFLTILKSPGAFSCVKRNVNSVGGRDV